MSLYERYIDRAYPGQARPPLGVVATDLFMPFVLLFVVVALIAMPFMIYKSIQAERVASAWAKACEDRGGQAVVNHRGPDLCIVEGYVVEVRR